jgi:phosphopantothenoylcysteine synthetase/decarboxylase
MKVIVTCGPGYEPIDQVRRITNFSTGELGVRLCNELARAGFEVFCLKGIRLRQLRRDKSAQLN